MKRKGEVVACVRGVQSYTLNKENKEDVFTLALVEAFERVGGMSEWESMFFPAFLQCP